MIIHARRIAIEVAAVIACAVVLCSAAAALAWWAFGE